MASLDVFATDAFTMTQLTASVNLLDFLPQLIGGSGIFTPQPVATTTVWIEERDDVLALVPNTPRGAPPDAMDNSARRRNARQLALTHLPKRDAIIADELQNVRAFGSESEAETVMRVVNQRMEFLRRDIELTWENLMLGAIKGTILDADGSTVIYDLFSEFGVSQEAEVDFDLDAASPAAGALRTVCTTTIRTMLRNLKGGVGPNVRIVGLCSDTFWDDLIAHSEVRETYLNWAAAADLRGGAAFGGMTYGGIEWFNYRGTDDASTVTVAADKCHLFPANIPGLFPMYYGPADTVDYVNTMGLPFYAMQSVEPRWRKQVDIEVQSNPLPICTQPLVLMQGKRT